MTRPFTIIDAEQRSPAWFQARAGRLTGSHAVGMLAIVQKGEAAGRRNLRAQLMLERITGKSQDSGGFQSDAMRQGIEREADAAALYEALTGRLLVATGFLSHNTHLAGCSLDGHVDDFTGIFEAKSPIAATHLEYLTTGIIPGEYQKQITHNLWISKAKWCDWLSFNPDFPEELRARLVRVYRDESVIAEYEAKALAFLAEVDAEVLRVRKMITDGAVLRQAVGA